MKLTCLLNPDPSLQSAATQFWRSKVLEVAKDFPEYTFAIADEEDYAEELKSLELSDSGEEVNVGILGEDGKKFAMEPEEFDAEVLRDFVMAFKKGTFVAGTYFIVTCKKKTRGIPHSAILPKISSLLRKGVYLLLPSGGLGCHKYTPC